MAADEKAGLARARALLAAAQTVVALTGAGISTGAARGGAVCRAGPGSVSWEAPAAVSLGRAQTLF
ncbi:MAG: hypothetical protein LBH76_09705, partial [Propionibacteriaceae bacterium]|nr:hypothetical protein [Propionibacteriaceae bacterium]